MERVETAQNGRYRGVFPERWGPPPHGEQLIAAWLRSHIQAEQRTDPRRAEQRQRAAVLTRRRLDPVDAAPTLTGGQAERILRRRYLVL